MGAQQIPALTLQPPDSPQGPITLHHVVATGQSLGAGYPQQPVTLKQPFSNLMLVDSSNTYPTAGPFLSTLSLQPLVSPQRANVGGPYPQNINGETPDIAFINQLTALSGGALRIVGTNVARDAADITVINRRDGGGNSYPASLYEAREIQHVAGAAGLGSLCVHMVHGESDADAFNANYLAQLVEMRLDYELDLFAILGARALSVLPMVLNQQSQQPSSLFGPNMTGIAQWQAAVQNPGKFILAGPRYQWPYFDGEHMLDYRPLGELSAKAFWQEYQFRTLGIGSAWAPLWPTAFSRASNVVTITFNVPVAPLVWDSSNTAPHLTGFLSNWSGGRGFEAWDAPQAITACTGNGVSPIVLTVADASGYTNGQTALVTGCLGNTAANGTHTITVSGNNITLTGTTGNGTFSAGAGGAQVANMITISATPVISGNQVQVTLGRAPTTGLVIGYGRFPDTGYGGAGGGFNFHGRCGLLRDSDTFVGLSSGIALPNWCITFEQAVA